MQRKKKPIADRLEAHFERRGDNECWPWTGARDSSGYGRMRDDKAVLRAATRLMWAAHVGPIPDGMNLLHKCDNRPCVNPNHLFLGSSKENTLDMHEKDRGRSKLTCDQVREIRRILREDGRLQADVAAEYGVKEPCIQRIATRRTWGWVPD